MDGRSQSGVMMLNVRFCLSSMIDFFNVTSMGSTMLETLETAIHLEPGYFDATDFPTTENIVRLLGKSYSVRTVEGDQREFFWFP